MIGMTGYGATPAGLGAKVAGDLREDILNCAYASGESITETMLCQRYQVSRTPVREALRQLELEGLIKVTPNKSPVVVGISHQDMLDNFDIRISLEGMAAEKAAENIDEAGLAALKESLDLLEFYVMKGDSRNLGEADTSFHDAIYAASGSRPLRSVLRNSHYYTRAARLGAFRDGERAKKAYEEHAQVYEAIRAGDGKKARELATAHVCRAKEFYLARLEVKGNE